jgi:hypothetical protein
MKQGLHSVFVHLLDCFGAEGGAGALASVPLHTVSFLWHRYPRPGCIPDETAYQFPKLVKLRLTRDPSRSLSPSAPAALCLSLPARSTKLRVACLVKAPSRDTCGDTVQAELSGSQTINP